MERQISAWREISKGGDIPWHRVYGFKYKDKLIWDREKKECLIDELLIQHNKLQSKFKIVSYNILDDKSFNDRKAHILKYLSTTDSDVICLQEVSGDFITAIKTDSQFQEYEIATTDLITNNIVFLSRCTANNITLIRLNSHNQALKITVRDHNDISIDFIGVHLTCNEKKQNNCS